MKKNYLLLSVCLAGSVSAQHIAQTSPILNTELKGAKEFLPTAAEFSVVVFEKSSCLSADDYLKMNSENEQNKRKILEQNPEAFASAGKITLFQQPFRPKAGFSDYGYHTLQNQVDHDMTPNNHLLDYHCGQRTYDWATGNHGGTDYILWPYPWRRMQENVMEVVAAAPGIIINKRNTFADQNCLNNGNPNWNGIVIEHADGSTAIYLHFKKNSATTKNVGDMVSAGEFLGVAGSSGSSTIPHLHFEVRTSAGDLIDPYQGSCNGMNTESWWQSQENYFVPRINRISTHYSATQDNTCPQVENTYERTNFNDGDPLIFKIFYRDIRVGDVTQIRITDPDGAVVSQFSWAQNWGAFYPTAYAFWQLNINSTWQTGIYNLEATFGGNTYSTIFGVRTALATVSHDPENFSVYPNPADDVLYSKRFKAASGAVVLDMSGKVLLRAGSEMKDGKINIRLLQKGVYFLQLTQASGETQVVKFIKK